jgi:hypothetical protein
MGKKYIGMGAIVILMIFAFPLINIASAEDVGQFTRVVPIVDHLKGGQPPVVQAKVADKVANKDVVETHKEARAQMKFVDDTIVTVAPNSKVTIDNYMYDSKKGTTKATFQLLQGLVHTVVPSGKQPDLIIKTNTSIMGIRG